MTTAATYFSERQAEHDVHLAQAAASQAAMEKELVAAVDAARRDHAAAAAAAADELARRDAELATAAASRDALKRQLADAEAAARAGDERAAEAVSARDAAMQQAALRQAELEAQVAQGLTDRQAIELDLAKAQATHHEVERRHAAELGTSAAQIAELEAARKSLQDRLTETETGIRATQERAAAERAEADQQAAARQAELEVRLAQDGAERRTLQAKLEESAASADLLTQRGAELTASLAHAGRLRETLEQQVSDAAAALEEAQRTRTSDAEAYLRQAAIRKAEFEERLRQEATARARFERDLAATRQTSEQDKRRFDDDIARVQADARDRETRLEDRLARERDDHARALAEAQEVVRHLQAGRDALQQSLGEAETQRERLERARLAGQAELERAAREHAAGRARLEALVTERESQLREQSSGHAASLAAAKKLITQNEARVAALNQELVAEKSGRAALRAQADAVPALKTQLEESQAESRRRFEQNPHGMCRCNREGALTQANRALASLLGYRTSDDLRRVNVATAVFESADDLRWLIDRCLSTGTPESVETTWKRKDGDRLIVKLLAVAAAPDAIEIVVEDLTTRRGLEERLRQAQRMEAVGRLASEVAVTCDNLLRDVSQDGEQWLATIDGNTALRHRAEQLLAEVTRAGHFLRQLAAYGRKQTRALEPVNVTTVMRDMEPVLKRVAGDDIELLLPKTTRPVNVDVEAERVERVLVNVASYARERMPSGGRLKIELASVVVDGRFIAKHPNVRPGAHVLITVTEVREAARLAPPGAAHSEPAAAAVSPASDKPGVDLGALLKLIADCGGHLWMTAEPPGNMILKIHLPKRTSDDPRPVVTRSERGGSMSRWFGH